MTQTPQTFYDNRLLFGRAGVRGHLAFGPGDDTVRVYSRDGDTRMIAEPFRPFLLLSDPDLLKGFKKKSGTGTYDARLFINDEFKVRFEFDNGPQGVEQEKALKAV